MKTVTFRQLRVFVEVAKNLSFIRAAESLHLTPPAVTMQIKELESAIELPLLDRQGRKVSLTTAGEYFLVYAKRLLTTLKDADDAMARFRKLESGLLNVGMVGTAKYFLPHLLTRFREEHPGIELRLQVGANREQLVGMLEQGEVDLAIMGRPPKEMATRAEPFAAHPHVFVAPPGHPILAIGHPPLAAAVLTEPRVAARGPLLRPVGQVGGQVPVQQELVRAQQERAGAACDVRNPHEGRLMPATGGQTRDLAQRQAL